MNIGRRGFLKGIIGSVVAIAIDPKIIFEPKPLTGIECWYINNISLSLTEYEREMLGPAMKAIADEIDRTYCY